MTADITVDVHLTPAELEAALRADVREGLTADRKELPPKWFYDDHGCELFDAITRLPEYYPTETERSILTAHAAVARTAAYATAEPEQRWMLRQARDVRRSFADEVFGRPDAEERQEIWMLRQPKAVRESFIREVLERDDPPPRQAIWMLRQADKVRESFVREVLEAT